MVAKPIFSSPDIRIPGGKEKYPSEWRWESLNAICTGIYDCPHSTPNLTLEGPYVARTQDVITGIFHTGSAAHVSQDTYQERVKRAEPSYGDLLYSREGTYFGIAAEVPPDAQVCLGQRMVLIRADAAHVDHRFLRYWLNSPVMSAHIHGQRDGSVAERLNLPTIRALPIPLPGAREQRRIVSILGALDDKIYVNERIAETADRLSESIYCDMVQNCDRIPMSTALTSILGGTPDRRVEAYWGGSVPWASAKDIVNTTVGVLLSTEECITESAAQNSRAKKLRQGSVVLTARGTVGAVARLAIPAAINQSCYAFEPGKVPSAVLFHLVRSASESMLSLAHGTVFSTVNMKTFDHVQIPDLEADDSARLNEKLLPLHRLIEDHLRESRTLATLRDILLPQLISGRLRVKDAEKIIEANT